MMRQAVVQETGGLLSGLVLSALALLLSNVSRRYEISGALFGAAVGVHLAVVWMVPGFWYLVRKDETALKTWAIGASILCAVGWAWGLLQFRTSGVEGSWLVYILGGVGVDALGPSALFSGLMRQIDAFAQIFGWGGFVIGASGLLLMAFLFRERFLFFALLGGPFLFYRITKIAMPDDAVYLAILGPVFALGAGTAWRAGSGYLAEGLQETVRVMLWVTGVVMILVQVVCVFYTQNVWANALNRRVEAAEQLDAFRALGSDLQSRTNPDDLVVVMSDPKRPGLFNFSPSLWAVAWHVQRQVVFGRVAKREWQFDTVAWQKGSLAHTEEIDDAFINQAMRRNRRFFSTDPFPFLHTSTVENWLSALPVLELDGVFELKLGQWPQVENPDVVAEAFLGAFDTYVSRGYSSDAAACLQGMIAYQPTNEVYTRKLGDLYMKMGAFPSAVAIYEKLLALMPDEEEVAVNLSGAYYSSDNLEKAIAVCEQFLIAHPFSPEILYNLAGYYRLADRGDEARELYKLYVQMGDAAHRKDEAFRALSELARP
ncbi:MAG: tetratricopeptide repeat protein, partial [Candidatus Latescibacteria bacterium]|nr:tetratricopeptide repeat protein [Candidatus Latescibacterota bacterium]